MSLCTSCGAENNDACPICEYCGAQMDSDAGASGTDKKKNITCSVCSTMLPYEMETQCRDMQLICPNCRCITVYSSSENSSSFTVRGPHGVIPTPAEDLTRTHDSVCGECVNCTRIKPMHFWLILTGAWFVVTGIVYLIGLGGHWLWDTWKLSGGALFLIGMTLGVYKVGSMIVQVLGVGKYKCKSPSAITASRSENALCTSINPNLRCKYFQ